MERVVQTKPDLAKSVASLTPRFRQSLLASTVETASDSALDLLERSVSEVQRAPRVCKVGLWDMSSQVGRLPSIVAALNEVQPAFAFFELQAAVPAGLLSRPERVWQWASDLAVVRPKDKKSISSNVILSDFARRAEVVRKDFGIDYLVGIAASKVASDDEDNIYWDSFSALKGRIILVSTYDLYKYAAKAGRPFEAAVAYIAIATLMVAANPRLQFHEENTGCMFDENQQRSSIVKDLAHPMIEERCLKLILPRFRSAAEALVKVLGNYSREAARTGEPSRPAPVQSA